MHPMQRRIYTQALPHKLLTSDKAAEGIQCAKRLSDLPPAPSAECNSFSARPGTLYADFCDAEL